MGDFEVFFEAMDLASRNATAGRHAMQLVGANSGGFNIISLGQWLDLCRQCRIPHVPAMNIGKIAINDLIEPIGRVFEEIMADQVRSLGAGWMARWDCCSMAETKYRLSQGLAEYDPVLAEIYSSDFRAIDIILDFPDTHITAWARPWLEFAKHGGWPIEYRAFVVEDRLLGISNYYPQMSLPDNDAVRHDISRITEMCRALISAQKKPINCPRMEGFDMSKNSWTADFARLPSGALLFLEGGPPHTMGGGAHPCCFEPGKIDGIALSLRGELHG